mgnify:CR=1 FL=1
MDEFLTQRFNQTVGVILLQNRERIGLSRQEVVSRLGGLLTASDLQQIETGKQSIICSTLYRLLWDIYLPTEDEILFFCCVNKNYDFKKPSKPISPNE